MKHTMISRRSFLLGLAACSAGVLAACGSKPTLSRGDVSSAGDSTASSAASVSAQPFLTPEEFPRLDGSTACVPLMAQMLADTTGMDLTVAQSSITVSTTSSAWSQFGL